jgi:hypothetical protein
MQKKKGNATYQNPWDTAKAGKSINTYIKKQADLKQPTSVSQRTRKTKTNQIQN